jgi:hypothetical protein
VKERSSNGEAAPLHDQQSWSTNNDDFAEAGRVLYLLELENRSDASWSSDIPTSCSSISIING